MSLRRRARLRLADLPRLFVGGVVEVARLFSGRYGRVEGAHVLATDAAGRILVVRTTYLGPGWMLPGGRVERGETPHAAAIRETREETGLTVTVERLLLVDARRASNVSFIFAGTVVGGALEPQLGEIAEVAWMAREELAHESARLRSLLDLIDAADGVVYIGL